MRDLGLTPDSCHIITPSVCMKEKQGIFRTSSVKNKHISITGRLSITPPQVQAESVDFDSLFNQLSTSMDQFQNDVREVEQTTDNEQLQFRLKVNRLFVTFSVSSRSNSIPFFVLHAALHPWQLASVKRLFVPIVSVPRPKT